MSPIIDIQKRLVEVGRIRMGQKSSRGAPQKLETFRITSRDQARVEEIAATYGGTVRPWNERPGEFEVITDAAELTILLLPGQALSQWYEHWSAGGCLRRCDGVTDVISDGPCVCDLEPGKERKCKPTTRLSVMLPEIPGLGVWRLESHGYYAAVELSATAGMLEQATARGQMFPARLRIDQRSQVKEGKTTRYAVPVIDIDVRLPEALGAAPLSQPQELPVGGYRPIAAIGAGVSVTEGLEAAARQADPKAQTARSAEPIGPTGDFIVQTPVPVPEDEPAPPDAEPASEAQKKKLNVLVGKLRPGKVSTEQLWRGLGRDPVAGMDGTLHWSPLRDSLTKIEASALIERLTILEQEPPPDAEDAVEQAGRAVPPQEYIAGSAAGLTLAEIYAAGDDGVHWIRWALMQDVWPDEFRADLETFAEAKLGTAAAA